MSRFEAQPGIVTNGLVLNLDAGDPDSYTRSQPPYVEVLVVAGGGAGGGNLGGGGGAGGVLYNSAYQLTNAATVTVTVGAGGAGVRGSQSGVQGNDGSNSVFGSLTAIGGGGAGSGTNAITGRNGGSGGGASGYNVAAGGTGTAGQGFNGGSGGGGSPYYGGGGGGGAGENGDPGVDGNAPVAAGHGGDGVPFSILGTTYYFGGGGGGGVYTNGRPGNGGRGGGGGGGTNNTAYPRSTGGGDALNDGEQGYYDSDYPGSGPGGGDGGANTGGGGGGAMHQQYDGGDGGSGIVVVRYPGLPAATGGTITYVNGFTIHKFTSSGTFTPYLWNDVSGNSNDGTLTNGPTFIPNQKGGYIQLDGADDRIDIPNTGGDFTIGTGDFTINVWLEQGTDTTYPHLFTIDDQYNFTLKAIRGGVSNEYRLYVYQGYSVAFENSYLDPGNWQMVTLTRSSQTHKLYLNGALTDTVVDGSGPKNIAGGTAYLGWGWASEYTPQKRGSNQLYNRALSATEIGQNFNAQRGKFGVGWPSAEAILAAYPNAPSGYYDIQPFETTSPISVYCDMETNGGGWMHVGTISDNNESSNNSTNHPWGAPLNPEQDSGLWEDSNTLNEDSPSFTADYKNKIWYSSPFTQILIKDQGDTKRNLLYTNSGQITSNNNSLAEWFGSLQWQTNGSETSTSAYSNSRVTGLSITNFGVADPILDSGNKSILLFKFGERDGAQDANKDRSMIAWHRHNAGDNVDAPAGIGNFTNRGGTIDYRDIVPYAQRADFPGSSITGTPYNYSIWVR